MLIATASHIENENEMTEHTDAPKILILQLLLEKYYFVK
jgi:hypothetical protein